MFIYVVILVYLGAYKVHAPNIVFTTNAFCQTYKQADLDRLKTTAPSPSHQVISMCIGLPKDV